MTRWLDLTSPELDAIDRASPVVLPIGAVEQHGPHLPVSTDYLIAEHLAAAIDSRLGDQVLVLPAVAVGHSEHHMDFAGTLSARHSSLLAYLEDIADSIIGGGFRTLVIFNTHGGNQAIGQVALERLGARHRATTIAFTSWWRIAGPELLSLSETGPGGVGHACELETSIILAIAPHLVRTDLVPPRMNAADACIDDSDMLRSSRATVFRRSIEIAPTGVFGEPQAASADKGHQALDAVLRGFEVLVAGLRQPRHPLTL